MVNLWSRIKANKLLAVAALLLLLVVVADLF
jgi:hypothetical protein